MPLNRKQRLISSTTLSWLAASALIAAPVYAQDDEEESSERVVVTGSRIANSNITSPSPITTVGVDDIELSNTVNSEQFLNTLPQVIPGFDSSSNNPGIGEATVDLRGLGANRTLVLVNDRRYVTSNQNPGAVDLNTIPSALIERVDIVTGGASAVYGSDAVAGVVNFVLRDDFEGVELDTSYEVSENSDGEIFNTSLTMGGNFDGGRGNATLSLEYTSRGSVLQGDRDEAFFSLVDAGAEDGFRETGSVNIPSTFVFDTAPDFTAAGIDNPPCSLEGSTEDGGICTTDSFGWIFNPDGAGAIPFINSGSNTNRYNYAPVNYLQIPQERWSIFSSARYDLTDNIEAYGQAIFVSSQTEQLLAPTPVFTSVTVNLDNPFLQGDAQSLALLAALSDGDTDGDGVDDAVILTGRRSLEVGGRLSDIRNDSFQLQGGLRGDLYGWDWDVFASFGQAASTISQTGNVSVPAYQAAIREGRANIFAENGLTQDIVDEISVLGQITGDTEQSVIAADITGDLGDLKSPFAESPIGVAFGAEYREEELKTQGSGLGPDVVGFNQAPATFGRFDVTEIFGELNLPVIENAPLVEELTLTGAYRYSDYSTIGGVDTYAGGASWTPIPGLRFRGQYQRAVRAPNIGELFQPQVNGFPNIADPCSGGLGGYDDLSAADQAAADANCAADGVPAAVVGSSFQANSQIEGLFGGNPDLAEEVSDTVTIGAVFEPEFVPGLALSVDYYDIEVTDAIANIPSQTIFDLCYLDGNQSFCDLIDRNPNNGTVDIFRSTAVNVATLNAQGVDFTVDYSFDFGEFGTFGVYSLATYTEEASTVPIPGEAPIDCVGFYGATCGEPTPEWSFNTRFDWTMGDFGARVRWQRISSVEDDLLRNGGDPDLFVRGVDAYNQVDATGFWSATDNVYLSFGIENLFNTDYVLIGDAAAEQSNTFPATYDTIGRTYFGRISLTY